MRRKFRVHGEGGPKMNTRLPRCIGLIAALLCAGALPAAADTIVLDSNDVTDWVRVFSSGTWKQ